MPSGKWYAKRSEMEPVWKKMKRERIAEQQRQERARIEKKYGDRPMAVKSEPFHYDANCECGTNKHLKTTDESFSGYWIGCDRCSVEEDEIAEHTTFFHLECTPLCHKHKTDENLGDVMYICKFCRHIILKDESHPEDTLPQRKNYSTLKWMERYAKMVDNHKGSKADLAEKMSNFRVLPGEDAVLSDHTREPSTPPSAAALPSSTMSPLDHMIRNYQHAQPISSPAPMQPVIQQPAPSGQSLDDVLRMFNMGQLPY